MSSLNQSQVYNLSLFISIHHIMVISLCFYGFKLANKNPPNMIPYYCHLTPSLLQPNFMGMRMSKYGSDFV